MQIILLERQLLLTEDGQFLKMIVINFKNYKFGKETLELARRIEKYLPSAIACPPAMDVAGISAMTKLKVYAQHVDNQEGDRATGFVLANGLKKLGVRGSLLNHSEHRISEKEIKETIEKCSQAGLKIILCAESVAEARKFISFRPEAIAFEDRDLIGSGKSITDYKSDEVKKFVEVMRGSGVKALCGAGVSSAEDVRVALELGCDGVLIASAIAKGDLSKAEKLLKEISQVKVY